MVQTSLTRVIFKPVLGNGFDCRLSFAGARNGDLPTVLALISVKFFTPITSLVSQVSRFDVNSRGQLITYDDD